MLIPHARAASRSPPLENRMTPLPTQWKTFAVITLGACAAYAVGTAVAARWERMQHLAVPVLVEESATPSQAPLALRESPACELELATRIEGRVSALLEVDETLWIGGVDTGLHRREAGSSQVVPVPGLQGRERFVNALAAHDGRVYAATYAGLLELELEGRLRARHLRGIAVEALLEHEGTLFVGAAQGLYRSEAAGFTEVPVRDDASQPLRITSLVSSGGRLWMGTPSGVWDLRLEDASSAFDDTPRWHPLVFGARPANTNTVLALAALDDGVIAGTDDGGLVRIDPDGRTAAYAFLEPRANEINPGAAAPGRAGSLFGTQGGGLLLASAQAGFEVTRPRGWPLPVLSAVAGEGDHLLVGTDGGEVWRVACPSPVHP